ncbi:hypothetical protein RIF29_10424 [Crotalaria pallida]|uniref:Uncharacterized protein n=1 Tax=Crotalaria pallida TaxID=3830 RepID=A0AAN9IJV8_CROPI
MKLKALMHKASKSNFVVEAINRLKELLATSESTSFDSVAIPSSPTVANIDVSRLNKLLFDFKEDLSRPFEAIFTDTSLVESLSSLI